MRLVCVDTDADEIGARPEILCCLIRKPCLRIFQWRTRDALDAIAIEGVSGELDFGISRPMRQANVTKGSGALPIGQGESMLLPPGIQVVPAGARSKRICLRLRLLRPLSDQLAVAEEA